MGPGVRRERCCQQAGEAMTESLELARCCPPATGEFHLSASLCPRPAQERPGSPAHPHGHSQSEQGAQPSPSPARDAVVLRTGRGPGVKGGSTGGVCARELPLSLAPETATLPPPSCSRSVIRQSEYNPSGSVKKLRERQGSIFRKQCPTKTWRPATVPVRSFSDNAAPEPLQFGCTI